MHAQPPFVSAANWSRTGFIIARCSSGTNAADSPATALSMDEMEKNETAYGFLVAASGSVAAKRSATGHCGTKPFTAPASAYAGVLAENFLAYLAA